MGKSVSGCDQEKGSTEEKGPQGSSTVPLRVVARRPEKKEEIESEESDHRRRETADEATRLKFPSAFLLSFCCPTELLTTTYLG